MKAVAVLVLLALAVASCQAFPDALLTQVQSQALSIPTCVLGYKEQIVASAHHAADFVEQLILYIKGAAQDESAISQGAVNVANELAKLYQDIKKECFPSHH